VFIGLVVLGNIFNSELQNSPLSYFIFPPLLWGALRFNKVLLLTVTFLLSIMAIWFTTQGAGPFIRPDLSESLLFLQLFIGIISVTILILCSIVQERKAAESEIRSLNKTLSEKVKAEAALNRLLVTKIGRRVKH
jgi:integral membrane sensor domain MASE1